MGSKRTLLVVVAVFLAATAGLSATLYLNAQKTKYQESGKLVTVYVANAQIPAGTTGEQAISAGYIKQDQIPLKNRPETALTLASQLDTIKNKVALVDLNRKDIISQSSFVDASVAQKTGASRLDPTMTAVSVSVDQVKAVGGNLTPGDRVNIIAKSQGPDGPDINTEPDNVYTTVLQRVRILYIGNQAALAPGEQPPKDASGAPIAAPATSGTITFEVPPAMAVRIVSLAAADGGIYLTLVNSEYVAQANLPSVNDSVKLGKTETLTPENGKLTPYDDEK